MSIRQLEYFLCVCRVRHFGNAAAHCHVTQSTMSVQIAKLENCLGVSLFERDKRRVVPTDTAIVILPLADAVVSGFRQIREAARCCITDFQSDGSS